MTCDNHWKLSPFLSFLVDAWNFSLAGIMLCLWSPSLIPRLSTPRIPPHNQVGNSFSILFQKKKSYPLKSAWSGLLWKIEHGPGTWGGQMPHLWAWGPGSGAQGSLWHIWHLRQTSPTWVLVFLKVTKKPEVSWQGPGYYCWHTYVLLTKGTSLSVNTRINKKAYYMFVCSVQVKRNKAAAGPLEEAAPAPHALGVSIST